MKPKKFTIIFNGKTTDLINDGFSKAELIGLLETYCDIMKIELINQLSQLNATKK